jgi:hypothetical protein
MEDSNELQTPKKGGDQTPTGYHTPFKDRYHVPLDFEEGNKLIFVLTMIILFNMKFWLKSKVGISIFHIS